MDATPQQWARVAEAFKAQRKARGYPKRAPFAKEIGINDSTLAVAEGARPGPLSDDMRDFIATKLGWTPATWREIVHGTTLPLDTEGAAAERETVERALTEDLNPKLAEFNDIDLVAEIQTRMLLMAVRLGEQAVEWRIDREGHAELVSRITRSQQ